MIYTRPEITIMYEHHISEVQINEAAAKLYMEFWCKAAKTDKEKKIFKEKAAEFTTEAKWHRDRAERWLECL